jgi:dienelactone hydrolase
LLGGPSVASDPDPAVRRVDVTVVDRTRETPATAKRPRAACRVLPVEIRVPVAVTARRVPLIVVVHGLDGDPTSLGPLLDAWTASGHVVVAPTFPTTVKDSNGRSEAANNVRQAADVGFVVDLLLDGDLATGPLAGLGALVDGTRVGVAGMSLGGQTVYGLVAHTCCQDGRVDAAIVMAGVYRPLPGGKYVANRVPVMLVQGDADSGYHNSRRAYPALAPPKWFVTLRGARHAPPFEIPLGPDAPLVREVTTDFWLRYLDGDTAAASRIVAAIDATRGKATLQRDVGRT